MTIRDDARQEAERRWPDVEAWRMGVNAEREWRRAFIDGAIWASEQADRGCGHPNHGAEDHDCAPFLPDREPSEAEVEAAEEAIWVQVGRVPKEVVRAALLASRGENVHDFSEGR